MRTAKNILYHELIGLDCVVVKSRNRGNEGIKGKIIDETQKTLLIETRAGTKRVAKSDVILRVNVSDKIVEIVGKYLVNRPEDRIKRKFKKW